MADLRQRLEWTAGDPEGMTFTVSEECSALLERRVVRGALEN